MRKLKRRTDTFAHRVRMFITAWNETGEWTVAMLCRAMGLPDKDVERLRTPVRNMVSDGLVSRRVVSGTNNSNYFRKNDLTKPRYIAGFTL